MDANDIYYSDNSQLIDENNTEWIENTVLIENQDITWQEDGPEITVDYSETATDINKTLMENDGYLTANESNTETSQYFSILESNCNDEENEFNDPSNPKCVVNVSVTREAAILPDIAKREVEDNETDEEYRETDEENKETENNVNIGDGISDDQVIVYRVEGSDDLFAVQLADDGNGNYQKYKYRVRQNENGQLEAIPGSIEIQPHDQSDLLIPQNDQDNDHDENNQNLDHDHDQNNQNLDHDQEPDHQNYDQGQYNDQDEDEDDEPKDRKPNQETLALINQQISDNNTREIENNFYMNMDLNPEDYLLQSSYDQDQEEEYQTVEGVHVTGDSESNSQPENVEETEFVNADFRDQNSESEYEIEELDEAFQNEAEEGEIIEEDDDEEEIEEEEEEEDDEHEEGEIRENPQILQHKSNIDNMIVNVETDRDYRHHLSDNRNVTIFKDDRHLSYLVVKTKEKENVSLTNFNSSNPRSILKSNYSKLKTSTPKPEKHILTLPTIIANKESNPKPAKEPTPINNILVKSARQPRKQLIKPVERADEEIIVQPLIYSLSENNYLGPTPGKRKRVIEEVLQVSDESDPEFTLKPKKKKVKKTKHGKRGRPRNVEITIIDSDEDDLEDSEESVIEVLTDEDLSEDEIRDLENILVESRDSTETRKNKEIEEEVKEYEDTPVTVEQIINDSNKPNEIEETKIPEVELVDKPVKKSLGFKKNKCPHCPKTFPRLITLKKHMNIHSTRRSLRSRTSSEPHKPEIRKTENIKPENKPEKLENSKPENRKVENSKLENNKTEGVNVNVSPKSRTFNCLKCKLKFLTEAQYKRHQTVHKTIKRTVSPIKADKHILISQKHLRSQSKVENIRSQRLSQMRKSVASDKAKEIFKCEYCGQYFGSRTLLIVHRNSHKTFPCPNCKTTFTAKILLDDHLRKNCVKLSPKKAKPIKKFLPTKRINSKCEICQQIFPTPKSLQIHKNVSHKPKIRVNTSEDNKKCFVRSKSAHGGVPVSLKMQAALNKLKPKS